MKTKKKLRYAADLRKMGACREAREWLGERSLEFGWKVCKNPSWMFWWIAKVNPSKPWSDERKRLVMCAIGCALTAKKHWPKTHAKQIGEAVKIIQAWCNGKATREEAEAAREELWKADAASSAAAAYAAAAAAYAAATTYATTYAADAASAAAAYAAARAEALAKCCDIIRKHYPEAP